jgi:hypothetical protein
VICFRDAATTPVSPDPDSIERLLAGPGLQILAHQNLGLSPTIASGEVVFVVAATGISRDTVPRFYAAFCHQFPLDL